MHSFLSGQMVIALGLGVVVLVFLLRRSFLRAFQPPARVERSAVNPETESVASSAEAVLEKLEIRLFDFAREVEGRMQTKIAVLDRLIVDADREILRLQDLLAETKEIGRAAPRAGAAARQPDAIVPPPPADGDQREAA